ncbi:MAG TPA: CPBP family intramembrane metalloprotease [Firmicutes bacterium]|jgi:membrane protease YdiL (CAAX protease family)|nr:CPBP family intramembrane metalloprotease [Bacillota bacterium]
MKRTPAPTTSQANAVFLFAAVVTLVGSVLLQPRIGFGANLWVNEYVYILLPALLLAWLNRWPLDTTYKLRGTSRRNRLISLLAGVSLWITAAYLSKVGKLLLDRWFGVMPVDEAAQSVSASPYQIILLMIGAVVLAPICEEIMFRGFIQTAYERYSPTYGYLITGILFGAYHVLNGVSEVIPASVLGVGMGFLVSRTGSLSSSMLFHAAANLSAAFLGPALGLSAAGPPPSWTHLAAPVSLVLALLLLRSVDRQPGRDGLTGGEERTPLKGVVFLTLTILYLLAMGIMEIVARLRQ